jgi:hypothetical protein
MSAEKALPQATTPGEQDIRVLQVRQSLPAPGFMRLKHFINFFINLNLRDEIPKIRSSRSTAGLCPATWPAA